MQPANAKRKISGPKLLVIALLCAAAPVVFELISDGGKLGQPETGLAMVFTGFFLWPIALICLIIGLKRLFFDEESTASPQFIADPNAQENVNVGVFTGQQSNAKHESEPNK